MTDALHTYLNTCISYFYRDRVRYNFFLFGVVTLWHDFQIRVFALWNIFETFAEEKEKEKMFKIK